MVTIRFLLMMRHCVGLRSCVYWTMERGGKVSFERDRFSPKGGMSILVILDGVWITRTYLQFR